MSKRDASDVIYRNDYRTRYINYYIKKNNTVNAIVNINGGSGAANEASEVTYLAIGRTEVPNEDLETLLRIPIPPPLIVSTVSTLYFNIPPPLATIVTANGIYIIDGSSTLYNLSYGNTTYPAPIRSIAVDPLGNLYVATATDVYEHSVSSFISMNISGLTNVSAMTVNAGTFYLVQGGSQIYTATGNTAATIIAGTTTGFANGPGSSAKFNMPGSIALDPSGMNLWIADTENSLLRAMSTIPPYTVTTAAGNDIMFLDPFPTDSVGNRDGYGNIGESLLYRPRGLAVSPSGVVYIADTSNNNIRSFINGYLLTIAGQPGSDPIYDFSPPAYVDGPTPSALFNTPTSIFYYNSSLYITEPTNGTVRVITMI